MSLNAYVSRLYNNYKGGQKLKYYLSEYNVFTSRFVCIGILYNIIIVFSFEFKKLALTNTQQLNTLLMIIYRNNTK